MTSHVNSKQHFFLNVRICIFLQMHVKPFSLHMCTCVSLETGLRKDIRMCYSNYVIAHDADVLSTCILVEIHVHMHTHTKWAVPMNRLSPIIYPSTRTGLWVKWAFCRPWAELVCNDTTNTCMFYNIYIGTQGEERLKRYWCLPLKSIL